MYAHPCQAFVSSLRKEPTTCVCSPRHLHMEPPTQAELAGESLLFWATPPFLGTPTLPAAWAAFVLPTAAPPIRRASVKKLRAKSLARPAMARHSASLRRAQRIFSTRSPRECSRQTGRFCPRDGRPPWGVLNQPPKCAQKPTRPCYAKFFSGSSHANPPPTHPSPVARQSRNHQPRCQSPRVRGQSAWNEPVILALTETTGERTSTNKKQILTSWC